MTSKRIGIGVAAAVAAAGLGSRAQADAVLQVDFGVKYVAGTSYSSNDVQAGFYDYSVNRNGGTSFMSGDNGSAGVNYSQTVGGFTVTVDKLDATSNPVGTEWRDRGGEVTGTSVNDLLEDFVFARQNETLRVNIAGLTPGQTYQLVTYHHDSNFAWSTSTWKLDGSTIGTVTPSTGLSPASVTTITTTFTATGSSVLLTGLGTVNANALSVLNGFTLTAVPTPSALAGGLALLPITLLKRRR